MKILHVTTIDSGGAYKSALRLHQCLTEQGIESSILVRTRRTDSPTEEIFTTVGGKILSKIKNGFNMLRTSGNIYSDFLGTDISRSPQVQKADIIVLHWINSFLSNKEIMKLDRLGKPILWFMHDMWLFTGGCHVDGYCGKYEYGCGNCPQVKSKGRNDLSVYNFRRKQELLARLKNVKVAGPSQWIVDSAMKSPIMTGREIYCMGNLIDTDFYCPDYKRRNTEKKITIMFGAADEGTENPNKGFSYLLQALRRLNSEKYRLVIFGNSQQKIMTECDFEIVHTGYIEEEKELIRLYREADVFVNPSMQESFGYTACEAMACGTPVVAFPIGGLREQITHKVNGYLAEFKNVGDLARGIEYCAEHTEKLGEKAREAALKYSYKSLGSEYRKLFENMMSN